MNANAEKLRRSVSGELPHSSASYHRRLQDLLVTLGSGSPLPIKDSCFDFSRRQSGGSIRGPSVYLLWYAELAIGEDRGTAPQSPQEAAFRQKRISAIFFQTEAGGEPVRDLAEELTCRRSEADWEPIS